MRDFVELKYYLDLYDFEEKPTQLIFVLAKQIMSHAHFSNQYRPLWPK